MNRFGKTLFVCLVVLAAAGVACAGEGAKVKNAAAAEKIYRVGDLYKEKVALDAKKVTVKGKVVKVSSGIMNKNWIHLQDGSGNPSNKTNDLVITTTQDVPAMGKTITATGILHKDRDFGYGYRYEVILEEASFK